MGHSNKTGDSLEPLIYDANPFSNATTVQKGPRVISCILAVFLCLLAMFTCVTSIEHGEVFATNLGNMNAFPSLVYWSSPESWASSSLQQSELKIGFPLFLSEMPNTIIQYAFKESVPVACFSAKVLFDYDSDPELGASSVSYETDEFSVWAGQPESGYFNDCEWGIVARNKNDYVQLFMQIGNFSEVIFFKDKKLFNLDGRYHEVTVTYQVKTVDNGSSITVSGYVDGYLTAQIARNQPNYLAPREFGIIAKSMRVTPTDIGVKGQMSITRLDCSPYNYRNTPVLPDFDVIKNDFSTNIVVRGLACWT